MQRQPGWSSTSLTFWLQSMSACAVRRLNRWSCQTAAKRRSSDHCWKRITLNPNDPALFLPISNLSYCVKGRRKGRQCEDCWTYQQTLINCFQFSSQPTVHITRRKQQLPAFWTTWPASWTMGQVGALMLLDLFAAFDTVDNDILMSVLYRRLGVDGPALDWLVSISSVAEVKSSVTAPVNLTPSAGILVYCRVLSSAQSGSLNTPRI